MTALSFQLYLLYYDSRKTTFKLTSKSTVDLKSAKVGLELSGCTALIFNKSTETPCLTTLFV